MARNNLPNYTKNWLGSTILIVSAISWLSASSEFLEELLNKTIPSNSETLYFWIVTFFSAVLSILFGAFLSDKVRMRARFLFIWVISGAIISLSPLVGIKDTSTVIVLSSLFVATWGFGIPPCMAYFADSTSLENRAKKGGLILFLSLVLGVISRILLTREDIIISSFYLFSLRAFSLICLPFIKNHKFTNLERKTVSSFINIIKEKAVILYITPWTLFVLVNYLFAPIANTVQSEEFVHSITVAGTLFVAVFSILGGFLADYIGRRPVVIIGFVILGCGYAILGIFPSSIFSWYIYTVVDGIAWGMLVAIFLITLWGDLAGDKSSEKYYALGFMPFILSNFIGLSVGPAIANVVPAYAIFSFVAIFLFSAVVPLMFAPETLPEKVIRERELRRYIEKAKKIKEKFT